MCEVGELNHSHPTWVCQYWKTSITITVVCILIFIYLAFFWSFLLVLLIHGIQFIYIYFTHEPFILKTAGGGIFCHQLHKVRSVADSNAFVNHYVVTFSSRQRAISWRTDVFLSLTTLLSGPLFSGMPSLHPVLRVHLFWCVFVPPIPTYQSSLRAPSLRGPFVALRSARFASSSFLLSSRFFLDSSALLRPGWQRKKNWLNMEDESGKTSKVDVNVTPFVHSTFCWLDFWIRIN